MRTRTSSAVRRRAARVVAAVAVAGMAIALGVPGGTSVGDAASPFVAGGPVFIPKKFNRERNKLFFFISEEWQRQLNPVTALRLATVPTTAERGGYFSQTHESNGAAVVIHDPSSNAPFPGNQIPKARFNADGLAILSVFPAPNVSGQPAYNYQSAFSSSSPRRLDSQRADWNVNDRWRVYARYLHDNYTQNLDVYGLSATVPNLGTEYVPRVAFSGVVNVTTIISPTFTNEFIFGPSQNRYVWSVLNPTYTRSGLGLKYQSPYPGAIQNDIGPLATFGGVGNAPTLGQGQSTQGQPPWGNVNTNFDFTDNLAKVFSKHVVKVGFMIERDRKDQQTKNPTGAIAFDRDAQNPGDTNWAFSNALLGNFDSYSQASAQLWGRYRFTNAEWYVMDTWKLRPNLTLDVGIRFMILEPMFDAKNQIGTFNPSMYTASQKVTLYQKTLSNGAVAALKTCKVPAKENGKGEDFMMPIRKTPISCTAVQIENVILFDPTLDEEKVASARLTVTTDENGDLRAMQKGLRGAFTMDQVKNIIETSQRLGNELRKLVG